MHYEKESRMRPETCLIQRLTNKSSIREVYCLILILTSSIQQVEVALE
jgi:hypothetical protein